MAQLPEINFHQIRGKAPAGSRRDGFEELCSQLMISGGLVTWPAGTKFDTFGNPDGGREGRGVLPDGASWCWQAKYLFELSDDEFVQIDKSIRRAMTTESNLSRYYVVLPYDRPAGDTGRKKSAFTKWTEHVKKWEAIAEAAGKNVEFIYLGEHQLRDCLMQPSQVGRLRYWFDLDGFSDDRFRQIAARAEANAGSRYTPELNVALPIVEVFDGLGRTPAFDDAIRTSLGALRKARGNYGLPTPEVEAALFDQAIAEVDRCADRLDTAAVVAADQARRADGALPDLAPAIAETLQGLDSVMELLRKHCLRDGSYVGNAAGLAMKVQVMEAAVYGIRKLIGGRAWRSSAHHAVLITGTGGSGKTHLLCDLAKMRTANGMPTLVALGEHFESGPIDAELARIIGFGGPADQLLATFDAACQTSGRVGLLIIDAVNEAADRKLWPKYLGSFLNEVALRPHIRLIVSCRTEFLADTLPSQLQDRMLAFQHTGFREVAREAIRQFLDWYDIERPSFPLLDPEFTNPLFLKLLCTTLQQGRERRFPRNGIGTTWIYDSFLSAMDDRLAAEDRCDYDSASDLVRNAVEQVAAAMYANDRILPKADVDAITSALLPNRPWSTSLLNGMLKEGVLAELVLDGTPGVRFGYERLGDITIASLIAAKGSPEIKIECTRLATKWHRNSGVLQALASVLPEVHDVELIDVLEIPGTEYHHYAHGDFLRSLAWRASTAISDRSVELVKQLQQNRDLQDTASNALLQVATVPDHQLNAVWLHRHLKDLSLPERDTTWTYFCDRQDELDGHLPVLIDWAWSDASVPAADEVRYLVAVTLAWALASSHRPTRDNSTKALVALLKEAPTVYQKVLREFLDVDDDYVEERLLAVGCGIAHHIVSSDGLYAVADAVRDFTVGRGYWPENLYSRDYTRRVIEEALDCGWMPGIDDLAARVQPPYGSTWSQECRTADEVKTMAGPPDYLYSQVGHRVTSDLDDFRKYVINSVPREFDLRGEIDADLIARLIFDRALALGWTPELFQPIEPNPRPRSEAKELEGYAQKYIWIAFKQLLGRIADRYDLRPGRRDDGRTRYATPLDAYGHDIDPTLLLRRAENRTYEDTPKTWFAPAQVTFPSRLDEQWPINDSYIPQVADLLVSSDDSGSRWVVLEGHYQWSQPQAPEDAATHKPHHRIWTQIRSYLIQTAEAERWSKWATDQDWHGRWIAESGTPTGLLLADHPYKSDWPSMEGRDGTYYEKVPPPGDFVITTTQYGGIANDWDHSDSKQLYGLMPSTPLCTLLCLQRIDDFRWGSAGVLLAENFSTRETGPDTIHVTLDALTAMLRAERRCLLWTILTEKETTTEDHDWPHDGAPIFRTLSASYIYDGEVIQLLDANSRTVHAGGRETNHAGWLLPVSVPVERSQTWT